ncbi:RusA family crossover junction endodeoxyribonuclease [Bombilactobacillus thymidiniphilus]|uniref:RusA family crossover junction endodeoxyribonuclease n=1 Tax=Bombilactobacillus thymidiniphilus TaxID=2923363 RepID=A0ABY4PCU5_9LACO|nr:RusA family crossover junction endodeoxyribonuclease [Bombilactobacillus thymidiniphilus]UQS83583.1 RusA family crossover junction endodeoxyribonuclease [Bombilactobacillus thymidiniphilus]
MSEWQAIIPLAPLATPRPQFRHVTSGSKSKTITYYPAKYTEYMNDVQTFLTDHHLYNDTFEQVIHAPFGILAEIAFYLPVPKNQKDVKQLMRKTAPDIDNLQKAIFDSIFKDLKVRDSRIVGVSAIKMNEKNYPRTEIKLIGIEDHER